MVYASFPSLLSGMNLDLMAERHHGPHRSRTDKPISASEKGFHAQHLT
jgi:hypothetical protein